MRSLSRPLVSALALTLTLVGCDDDPPATDAGPEADAGMVADAGGGGDDAGGPGPLVVPPTYSYESRFMDGVDSVAHGGQTTRQVLILDLADYAASLTEAVSAGGGAFSDGVDDGEVVSGLEYFFSIDGADRAGDPIRLETTPDALQTTYGDLGDANLLAKLAGNDTSTDHVDWSTAFSGWSDASIASGGGGIDTPTNLVRAVFHTLEDNAIAYDGDPAARQSPVDTPMDLPVHVTESGVDLAQLLRRFLQGALAFAQASDDYGDDDVEGKGLLADNETADGAYTPLEHAWDEAFGYFGAAYDYDAFSAAQIAGGEVSRDLDGDDRIDLTREHNFAPAVDAARRDASGTVTTTYGEDAFEAFRTGRAIITRANGPLSDADLDALREQRDAALAAWEAAGAATVVHYLNLVLQAMADYGTPAFDHARFLELANDWAQMKGLALMFQFNPHSAMSDADFTMLHTLLGDAPTLPAAGGTAVDGYRADLRTARALLGTTFDLPSPNLGDDGGEGGW